MLCLSRDVVDEGVLHEFVGLVEDEKAQRSRLEESAVDQLAHAARRAHGHVARLAVGPVRLQRHSADEDSHVKTFQEGTGPKENTVVVTSLIPIG